MAFLLPKQKSRRFPSKDATGKYALMNIPRKDLIGSAIAKESFTDRIPNRRSVRSDFAMVAGRLNVPAFFGLNLWFLEAVEPMKMIFPCTVFISQSVTCLRD
ncbi:hypothetical protein M514_01099 [Trichuris suis]|uniref:Uncharacterized protein n=1 Tax=Trichuris suis TaxID=68888 RepID=A0A085MKX0_9BILA|nr:hypothetical protein M513_01099 [Trichuris suis]KFD62583.1 hypothetical protein M514_01099 [Trichuris suis]